MCCVTVLMRHRAILTYYGFGTAAPGLHELCLCKLVPEVPQVFGEVCGLEKCLNYFGRFLGYGQALGVWNSCSFVLLFVWFRYYYYATLRLTACCYSN